MSDEASLRVTDAVRIEVPGEFRPTAIVIAHASDGTIHAGVRAASDAEETTFAARLRLGERGLATEGPLLVHDEAPASDDGDATRVAVNDRAVVIVDGAGTHRFDPLSSRARAHAPAITRVNGRWAAAWVSEDTGKLVMARGLLGEPSARVAEVWCALERPWASAPALVGDATGAWIAWREERGPRAGVYLRRLDATMRQIAREVRISDRAAIAAPGRVAMVSIGESAVALGWIESRDGEASAWVRTVAM